MSWFNPPTEKHQAVAYQDGWEMRGKNSPRHERPIYTTHEEREAHGNGWDAREKQEIIAAIRARMVDR